jgi:prepilin-type N-terminal cleavage/methylation domain-containing protein
MQRSQRLQPGGGFTLVEVLIVVAIIGMVSLVVVPSISSSHGLVTQAATRAIVADLTTAQSQAIARQAPIFAVFEPDKNRYKIVDQQNNIISEQWGGNQTRSWIDFDENSRFQGVNLKSAVFDQGPVPKDANVASQQIVRFDDLGAPDAGGTVTIEYNRRQYKVKVIDFTGRIVVRESDS